MASTVAERHDAERQPIVEEYDGLEEVRGALEMVTMYGSATHIKGSDRVYLIRDYDPARPLADRESPPHCIASVAILFTRRVRREWYLASLCTDPRFRGRGHARRLVQHIKERLTAENPGFMLRLLAHSDNEQEKLIRFYQDYCGLMRKEEYPSRDVCFYWPVWVGPPEDRSVPVDMHLLACYRAYRADKDRARDRQWEERRAAWETIIGRSTERIGQIPGMQTSYLPPETPSKPVDVKEAHMQARIVFYLKVLTAEAKFTSVEQCIWLNYGPADGHGEDRKVLLRYSEDGTVKCAALSQDAEPMVPCDELDGVDIELLLAHVESGHSPDGHRPLPAVATESDLRSDGRRSAVATGIARTPRAKLYAWLIGAVQSYAELAVTLHAGPEELGVHDKNDKRIYLYRRGGAITAYVPGTSTFVPGLDPAALAAILIHSDRASSDRYIL